MNVFEQNVGSIYASPLGMIEKRLPNGICLFK